MTAREAKLYELAHQQHLIQAYSPTVLAAGYAPENVSQLCGADVYFLATAIQGALKGRVKYVVDGCFGSHDYIGALRAMTPRERDEMRERIGFRATGE